MSKKITKTISVFVALNETAWYDQKHEEVKNLSDTARLALKRNMKALSEMASDFRDLQRELEQELQDKFTTDEKSVETELEGPDGNMQPGRRIKDEFIEEYQKEVNEVNAKLDALALEEDEIELYVIDLDAEIARIDEKDLDITDEAIDMLSLFEGDE